PTQSTRPPGDQRPTDGAPIQHCQLGRIKSSRYEKKARESSTVPSRPTEARRLPFKLNFAWQTTLVWPSKVQTLCPVRVSQTFISPLALVDVSPVVEASHRPSRLKLTLRTGARCSSK